ncbi:MAG TPA: hypothetical protein VME92_09535 [Acetobacteraceae bacterium]|nr:hypothetical protein [Acetobacteraceae bacterium]
MKTVLLAAAAALAVGTNVALAASPAHSMYQPPITTSADPGYAYDPATQAQALAGVNPAHAQYVPYALAHPTQPPATAFAQIQEKPFSANYTPRI